MFVDRDRLAATPARETALDCVEAGVAAARPAAVVDDRVALDGDLLRVDDAEYDLTSHDEVVVLGGGKAAGQVAAALEAVLGDRIADGAVVTDDPVETERVDVLAGDHPVPSEQGVESTRTVRELAAAAEEDTLVLAVVTGGASALLPAPTADLDLAALRGSTRDLLDAGAEIDAVNAVRKHCSALKGGRLAAQAAPATVVGLLFSDVVGDDPAVVGSGPTAPDDTTFADAVAVLDRYDLDSPVRDHLERGVDGDLSETPGSGAAVFDRVENHVLANAWTALDAARERAEERGYEALVLSSRVRGEARESATTHVAVAEEVATTGTPVEPPAVLLSGGETTVTVRGDGEGGPNQEFALSAALDLDADVAVASVDTDGRDGSTDAAGGLVDASTVSDDAAARDALADNDAYSFLDAAGALVRTGRTGTNVNDLRVFVVE
ncbi:glycerate kinase type-2 family protein [Halomicrococcus gelatinilyticus]|uniref:glycerate kinase type-2 family protein n=1 Tax=Halomicrococcus gelatinilyticus TaxID=1702103 RepID=UPI002E113245